MRTSQYLLSTLKETPADAEVISHQLMLRAGMIRKLASGLYTWLPTGVRVLKKVENIVREEMNNAGAIEVSMPVVQPADLWQESGRWEQYGPELLRFVDQQRLGGRHVRTSAVVTETIGNRFEQLKHLDIGLILTRIYAARRERYFNVNASCFRRLLNAHHTGQHILRLAGRFLLNLFLKFLQTAYIN